MQQTCWNSSRQFVAVYSPIYKIPAALLLSNLSQSKQQKPVDIFRALQLFSRRAQASLPALGTRRTTQALNDAWPWIPSVSSLVRAPPPQLLCRAVTRHPYVSAEIVPCSIRPVATFVDWLIMSGWLVTVIVSAIQPTETNTILCSYHYKSVKASPVALIPRGASWHPHSAPRRSVRLSVEGQLHRPRGKVYK